MSRAVAACRIRRRSARCGLRTRKYNLIFFYGLPLDETGAIQTPTPAGDTDDRYP